MSILDEVYAQLKRRNSINMHIPHSVVTLSCVAVRHNLGIDIPAPEMEEILYDEGLLPATEYKMPKWYRLKYMYNR